MGRRIKNKYIGEFKVWIDDDNIFELLEDTVKIKLPVVTDRYINTTAGKLLSEYLHRPIGNFELVSYRKI